MTLPAMLSVVTEPPIPLEFFSTAAQVIPVLLVLLAVENRRSWTEPPRESGRLITRLLVLIFAFIAELVALSVLLVGNVTSADGISDLTFTALGAALLASIAVMIFLAAIGFLRLEWSRATQ